MPDKESGELSSIYADEMGLVECQEKCDHCHNPLHYKVGQGIPFCWECTVDRETARRGKELLSRVRRLDVFTERRQVDRILDPDGDQSNWPMNGMPL